MSGGLRYGIAATILAVPWAFLSASRPDDDPKEPAPPPRGPSGPSSGPSGPPSKLRFPHTSLEGCADTLEWIALPPLLDGSLWLASADAPWREDGGLERFRPTPCWNDALAFAAFVGAQFPAVELSDLIWQNANTRLRPHPLDITKGDMMGEAFAIAENRLIEAERDGRDGLISTVGKDYVLDPSNRPGQCTIYGWHQLNGKAIQGVNSHSHDARYHDYSHHPRMVKRAG